MARYTCLFLILLPGVLFADETANEDEILGVVGRIDYDIQNIFDLSDPLENRSLYRWMNRFHLRTREKTVRKQLLFREGDEISQRLVDESERILRRKRYFYDANIKMEKQDDGTIAMKVVTRDVWSLTPEISLSRKGGENRSQIGFEETNLFGLGQTIQIAYDDGVDRESTNFEFSDPHLGRSWVSGFLRLADNSDGHSHIVSLIRPFIQLDAKWSAGFTLIDDDRRTALYRLGEEAAEFQQDTQTLRLFRGWSAGLKGNWVQRWTLGATLDDRRFSAVAAPELPQAIPRDRKLVYPFASFELLENRFEKSENRNQIGRTEDFFLGTRFYGLLGYAATGFGADREAWIVEAAASRGFGSMNDTALLLDSSYSARVEDREVVNSVLNLSARYFHRQSEKRLFYAGVEATLGNKLDLDNPVQIGGDSGLRGYRLRYQNGDSRVLFTVEQRYFTDWYPFRLVRVGGAIFFDAGRSFGDNPLGGQSIGWLKDAGFGLRFAPTRGGTTKIIHLDLAFPLDGDDSIDDVQILLEAKRSF